MDEEKESRRVRRPKFSEREVMALVRATAKRWSVLFGLHSLEDQQQSASLCIPRKDAWIEVTREVNKVSQIQRSILDIKKKMTALKYAIRKQQGDGKRKEPVITSSNGLVSEAIVEPRPWEKILRELMNHNTCEESDLQKLETEFDISLVIPGCSGRQDKNNFLNKPSPDTNSDLGGLSYHTQSASWIKEEKPLYDSDTDTTSCTDMDSCDMPSDGDQVRRAKRRRLRVSITAQAIVDIQRNLQYSVDRLQQHWSEISSMNQHLGGVTNSIQDLVAITRRLGSVLGQNIQSSRHGGWDNNITNNHKNQPSLPSHTDNDSHTHTEDHLSTHVHMQETVVKDNRDGVQGFSSSLSAGAAELETNQSAFTNQDDEEELFGRYIAAAVRKLTDRSRSQAKLKIQQVIFNLQEADGRNILP